MHATIIAPTLFHMTKCHPLPTTKELNSVPTPTAGRDLPMLATTELPSKASAPCNSAFLIILLHSVLSGPSHRSGSSHRFSNFNWYTHYYLLSWCFWPFLQPTAQYYSAWDTFFSKLLKPPPPHHYLTGFLPSVKFYVTLTPINSPLSDSPSLILGI